MHACMRVRVYVCMCVCVCACACACACVYIYIYIYVCVCVCVRVCVCVCVWTEGCRGGYVQQSSPSTPGKRTITYLHRLRVGPGTHLHFQRHTASCCVIHLGLTDRGQDPQPHGSSHLGFDCMRFRCVWRFHHHHHQHQHHPVSLA